MAFDRIEREQAVWRNLNFHFFLREASVAAKPVWGWPAAFREILIHSPGHAHTDFANPP